MKEFILNLQFIFRPSFWLMNYKYSKDIDEIMQYLLNKYEFTEVSEHTAKLGEIEIWIENQPYASIVPRDLLRKGRASRLTILKGINKLKTAKANKKDVKIEEMKRLVFSA